MITLIMSCLQKSFVSLRVELRKVTSPNQKKLVIITWKFSRDMALADMTNHLERNWSSGEWPVVNVVRNNIF